MADETIIIEVDLEASATGKTLAELNKEIKEQTKILNENFKIGEEGYEEQNKLLNQLKATRSAIRKEQRDQQRELVKQNKVVKGSYNDLSNELNSLRKQIRTLSKEELDSDLGKGLVKRINELDTELKEFDASIGQFQRNVGNYQSAFNGLGGALGNFGGALGAIAGAFIGGQILDGIVDLGTAAFDAAKQFQQLSGSIEMFSGLQGDALTEATSQVEAISSVYQVESDEIVRAANATSKALGIEFTEALALQEQGFAAGANASGEYLDSLSEYAVQARAAGITGQELNEILALSTQEGIFSDKGIDVVKEGGLRLREQADATKKSLESAFGADFTESLFQRLNDGSITTIEAIREVSGALDETNLTAQQSQQVIADVFGSAGEDAGLEYIKLLKDVDGNLEDIQATSSQTSQRLSAQLEQEKETAEARNELLESLLPALESIEMVWLQVQEAIFDGLSGIIDLAGTIGSVLGDAFDFAIGFAEDYYGTLIDIVTLDFSGLGERLSGVLDDALDLASDLYDVVADIGSGLSDAIREAQIEAARTSAIGVRAERVGAIAIEEERQLDAKAVAEISIREAELAQKLLQEKYQEIVASGLSVTPELAAKATEEIQQELDKSTRAYIRTLPEIQKEVERTVTSNNRVGKSAEETAKKVDLAALSISQLADMYAKLQEEVAKAGDSLTGEQIKQLEDVERAYTKLLEATRTPLEPIVIDIQTSDGIPLLGGAPEQLSMADGGDGNRANFLFDTLNLGDEEVEQLKTAAMDVAQQIADATFDIAQANNQRLLDSRLASIDAQYNAEIEAARGNQVLIEQAEQARIRRTEQAQAEAAKKEKQIAVKQAIVNGALAITKTFAAYGFTPAGFIAAGAQAISTAAQIATINAQQFAQGGITPSDNDRFSTGGMVIGKPHSQGGEKFSVGGRVVELEGGEAVINKRATRRFRPVLSAINQFGGGKKFASGGITPSLTAIADTVGGFDSSVAAVERRQAEQTQRELLRINAMQPVLVLDTLDENQQKRNNYQQTRTF